MSDGNLVEVVDRDGWRKEFPLAKAIVSIGSDPRNDVVLERTRGGGVSARHLQLISVSDGPGYRLINMGDTEVRLGQAQERALAPRAFVEIGPSEKVQVGEFSLAFFGGPRQPSGGASRAGRGGRDSSSAAIGLTLTMTGNKLTVGQPLEGAVTVRNLGDKTGVQFRLEAEGLDPECVEIGPAPILFPNAEKEVFFRVRHPQAAQPPAGEFRLRIRASAPNAYPNESTTAAAVIQIDPFYSHELKLSME
jgi:hypothetical protein